VRFPVVVAVSAVLAATGGCESQDASLQAKAQLDVAMQLQFRDIPVPADFSFDPAKSYSHWKDKYRFCKLCFDGAADVHSVAQFYKKHMLIVDWQLQSETYEAGVKRLEFAKDDERAIVTLGTRGDKTTLQVEVR